MPANCLKLPGMSLRGNRIQLWLTTWSFLQSGAIEFEPILILELRSWTKYRNKLVRISTDRYHKLTWERSTFKILFTHIAKIFLNHWAVSYGKPSTVHFANEHQIARNVFTALNHSTGVNNSIIMSYNRKSNGSTKRNKYTLPSNINIHLS